MIISEALSLPIWVAIITLGAAHPAAVLLAAVLLATVPPEAETPATEAPAAEPLAAEPLAAEPLAAAPAILPSEIIALKTEPPGTAAWGFPSLNTRSKTVSPMPTIFVARHYVKCGRPARQHCTGRVRVPAAA